MNEQIYKITKERSWSSFFPFLTMLKVRGIVACVRTHLRTPVRTYARPYAQSVRTRSWAHTHTQTRNAHTHNIRNQTTTAATPTHKKSLFFVQRDTTTFLQHEGTDTPLFTSPSSPSWTWLSLPFPFCFPFLLPFVSLPSASYSSSLISFSLPLR